MKINLLIGNSKDILNGYTNIDPFADGKDSRIQGNVFNLELDPKNPIVCDGEAQEIIAHEILDYFPIHDVVPTLRLWAKKLAFGGQLTVTTMDVEEVSRGLRFGNINVEQANTLLYGAQRQPWEFRKCVLSLHDLAGILRDLGLCVTKMISENFRCTVVANRPHFITGTQVQQ